MLCSATHSVESLGHLVAPRSAVLLVVLRLLGLPVSPPASGGPTPYSRGFRGAPLRSEGRTDHPPPTHMPVAAACPSCHQRLSCEVSQAPRIIRDPTGHFFCQKSLKSQQHQGASRSAPKSLWEVRLLHGEREDRIQRKRKRKKKILFTVCFSSPTVSQGSWKAFRLCAAPRS